MFIEGDARSTVDEEDGDASLSVAAGTVTDALPAAEFNSSTAEAAQLGARQSAAVESSAAVIRNRQVFFISPRD
jgi:hypothetical protein